MSEKMPSMSSGDVNEEEKLPTAPVEVHSEIDEESGKEALSENADLLLKAARVGGDYISLSRELNHLPELKDKTLKEKVDFLVENDIDPFKVSIQHASAEHEESMPDSYVVESMAKNPNLLSTLYFHVRERDVPMTPEQTSAVMLEMIKNGNNYDVESDDFTTILQSSGFDDPTKGKILSTLRENGYDAVAKRLASESDKSSY